MKFLTAILMATVFLVGCERIEGQLNITKELKLVNSKGKKQLIKVGTYSADLTATSSKKITLRLNDNSNEKYIFNHNVNIPDNGTFAIGSKVSGQPVDLSGEVKTVQTNSEMRETTQSCTYNETYQVCYPMPNGGQRCTNETRTVQGRQWIRYYDRYTTQNVNLSVKEVSTAVEVADFHGDLSYTDRIIVRESSCR